MTTRSDALTSRISDVARHAGVSVGTVSNVLNHPQKVSAKTIARVRHSIEELGFVRDANARSLAAGGSRSIGMVVIDLGNSIFVDAARGAHSAARKAGLSLLLAGCDDDFDVQSENVDTFNEARVAGLLLAPMRDSTEQIRRLTKRGKPVVLLNYEPETGAGCCVVIDNEQVGYLAARHLIDLGCDKIALVGSGDDLQPVRLRRRGVRRAVSESSDSVRFEEIRTEDLTLASAERAAHAIAGRGPATRPNGIIAVTDVLAAGVINALSERGISVPAEIAVMGCDHNSSAPDASMTVSTISARGVEMGAAAMGLLVDELFDEQGTHVHQRVVLEPELVVRGSTHGFTGR
jgi:LacI family transcriptional regulator